MLYLPIPYLKLRERQRQSMETVSYLAKWYHILYYLYPDLERAIPLEIKRRRKEKLLWFPCTFYLKSMILLVSVNGDFFQQLETFCLLLLTRLHHIFFKETLVLSCSSYLLEKLIYSLRRGGAIRSCFNLSTPFRKQLFTAVSPGGTKGRWASQGRGSLREQKCSLRNPASICCNVWHSGLGCCVLPASDWWYLLWSPVLV